MSIEKVGAWVGIIGGGIGIVGAGIAAITIVFQYFATQEQLRVVDCQQYYKTQIIEAQSVQIVYNSIYQVKRRAAAAAEAAYLTDNDDSAKLEAFKRAVDEQNEAKATVDSAKKLAAEAQKEIAKCGHRGQENFSA